MKSIVSKISTSLAYIPDDIVEKAQFSDLCQQTQLLWEQQIVSTLTTFNQVEVCPKLHGFLMSSVDKR